MMEKSKKKMKIRQLTKNEKILITLLGIVILFWISYKYIYVAQTEKLNALNVEKIQYEEKIEDINSTLRKEKSINAEWTKLNMEKEKIVSTYFPTLDQPQIIYLLNELTNQDNMEIQDMSFSRPIMTDFQDFQVSSMDISIPYKGDYSGIMSMLGSIKRSPRKITVDHLSMDKTSENSLSGNMDLRIYSLDGIAETNKDIIYIDTSSVQGKDNPFEGNKYYSNNTGENINNEDSNNYEGDSSVGIIESSIGTTDGNGNAVSEKEPLNPYIEETLLDFETRNSHFIPSQELVKGDVSLSSNSKSKKYSLKLEYNIVAIEEVNRAFVDVSKTNILIKYPPESIGMWIYSYDYSPVTFGIAFKGQMGEEILVPFTEGIGWTGWKHVQVSPPTDLSVYPLKLEKLYIEIPNDRDNYGVLLIDKLQALYTRNIDEEGNDGSIGDYIFHVVDPGDSIEKISERYYGTKIYKDEIRKLNELRVGNVLPVGKVLVLKKR